MNELQLVGYTADLKHLVFSDVADGARFKVPVDDDLVATLSEVLQLIDPDRDPFGAPEAEPEPPQWPDDWTNAEADAEPPPAPAPLRSGLFEGLDDDIDFDPQPQPDPRRNGRKRTKAGEGALAAFAASSEPAPRGAPGPTAATADDGRTASKLSPREIQALLRSGLTPRQVARRADSDEAWVRRWLAPIEAERRLVLEAVEQARVTKARLGASRDLLGEAVRRNLAEKGIRPDDDTVEWNASKREGDSHWAVTLSYRSRGRKQRAVWHFNPDTGELDCRNALAVDVAWTRPRRGGRARPHVGAPPARKVTAAKKATGKKAPAAKKAVGKKAGAAKPSSARQAVPKPVAKPGRKAGAVATAVKKPAVKKAAAKVPTPAKKAGTPTPAARGAARKR